MLIETHHISSDAERMRLSAFANAVFTSIGSRKGIKKAIRRGQFRVDAQQVEQDVWVQGGQQISLYTRTEKPPKPYRMELPILFADEHVCVVHKPAGLLVHGHQFKTLQNVLVHAVPKSDASDALPWPQPTHRLDAPTSGLLLVARSHRARIAIGEAWEQRRIQKTYHALCVGSPAAKGHIPLALKGKPALTSFETISTTPSLRYGHLSLLKLQPHTGRKHQLRIHCASIGHPILGDKRYAQPPVSTCGKGLFLCATALSFRHPITDEPLVFDLPLPHKFEYMQQREERRGE